MVVKKIRCPDVFVDMVAMCFGSESLLLLLSFSFSSFPVVQIIDVVFKISVSRSGYWLSVWRRCVFVFVQLVPTPVLPRVRFLGCSLLIAAVPLCSPFSAPSRCSDILLHVARCQETNCIVFLRIGRTSCSPSCVQSENMMQLPVGCSSCRFHGAPVRKNLGHG